MLFVSQSKRAIRAALVGLLALVGVVAFAMPAGAATPTRAKRAPGPLRVLLVGDSITVNYQSTAASLLSAKGYQVIEWGFAGSGLLDSLYCRGAVAHALVNVVDPDVVVYQSNGNYGYYSKCNANVKYGSPAFYRQWTRSANLTQDVLTRKGARFLWVLSPSIDTTYQPKASFLPQLNSIFSTVAASAPTEASTIDAWSAFGGETFDQSLRYDAEHLNEAGAQLMANLVVDAVG